MARCFESDVDEDRLTQEYRACRSSALTIWQEQPAQPCCAIWSKACREWGGAQRPAALQKILVKLAAFCPSSSGVEQSFSLAQWTLDARRAWLSQGLEGDELKVVCDQRTSDFQTGRESLLAGAQRIWARCYGVPRASGPNARASTQAPKRPMQQGTEAAFLKRRRAETAQAAAGDDVAVLQASGELALRSSSAVRRKSKI